jgi:molybdopterin converting factor small subunit
LNVRFLLWAQMRSIAGQSEIAMEIPARTTVGDALDLFYLAHADLATMKKTARPAVGNEYSDTGRILEEGDEISLIPPVQGG